MAVQHTFKVVLLGNLGVGKTRLINFDDPAYSADAQPTTGLEFRTRTFHVEGSVVRLQIWDTPGQEKFDSLKGFLFKRAQALVLVFDITDRESFLNVPMLKDDASLLSRASHDGFGW